MSGAAVLAYIIGISIHALVKRATVWASQDSSGKVDFNPRLREEGDLTSQICLHI